MSAGATVRAAALAALRDDPAIVVNRVIDGAQARGTPPYVLLREVIAIDWGTKDRAGRELRVGVTVRDAGETPARVEALAGAVEAALLAMPRDLDGWRVASLVPVRCAVLAEGEGRWAALIDVRARVLAVG